MRKYHDKPGRGRKLCSGCGRYVGVRTQVCGCGATFSTGLKTKVKKTKVEKRSKKRSLKNEQQAKPEEQEPEEEKWVKPRWLVYAPAGKPKVELEGHSRSEIREWFLKTRELARNEQMDFHPSAYKYYITYFYKILTPEYKKCLRMLDRIFEEETPKDA